jgi:hypothetical protein
LKVAAASLGAAEGAVLGAGALLGAAADGAAPGVQAASAAPAPAIAVPARNRRRVSGLTSVPSGMAKGRWD